MSYHFTQFFSLDSPKAIKARAYGYMNAINYMAPASTAGVGDMCPWSSIACRALCLGEHSGAATYYASVNASRKAKTVMFMRARAEFTRELAAGIGRAARKAQREGLKLCVRLNGATDINWVATIKQYPDIQFVDYTKSVARALAHAAGKLPANYHITFSFAGDNWIDCERVLYAGGNVSVCFTDVQQAMDWGYRGFTVIDGDAHDLRHLDKGDDSATGVIVGLSPKGRKAKRDGVKLGFVIQT